MLHSATIGNISSHVRGVTLLSFVNKHSNKQAMHMSCLPALGSYIEQLLLNLLCMHPSDMHVITQFDIYKRKHSVRLGGIQIPSLWAMRLMSMVLLMIPPQAFLPSHHL